jgi:aspartyl-tRNA(Asn)/glutamyl-tRNA(Gln) amidotransferase subunit A
MKIDLANLDISKARRHLDQGDFSVVELTESYLKNIEEKDKDIQAYLEVFDDCLEQAKNAQKRIDAGEATQLTGIPLAVKDNILIKGRKVSAGSKILDGYRATYDASVIERLKKEGVVFLGRTNCDEFAMGTSTENSAFQTTKNPHDLERVAGGSSGGSTASVAAQMSLFAIGSETGGSIRLPSSFCGTVGLKTTYGSVSRHGLIAMASSLDQIGPITNTITDTEIVFNIIKGEDRMDSTTIPDGFFRNDRKDRMVVGVPRDFIEMDGLDGDVLKNFSQSVEKMKNLGYEIKDISFPELKYSLSAYYIIVPAEVSTNLARFDGVKYGLHKGGKDLLEDYIMTRGEGFGPESLRRIILGTYVLSSGYYDAYYNKANVARDIIRKKFSEIFKQVDLIAMPVSPSLPFKIGEKSDNPLELYLADIFTAPVNLAGIPAISIPAGTSNASGKDLPIGFQLIAGHGNEDFLFQAGKKFLGEV